MFDFPAEMAREEFGKIGYTLDAKVREHFKVRENEIVIFYPEIFWSKFEPKAVEYSKVLFHFFKNF